jgi:cell cycle arrest protein BUB3
VGIAFYSSVLLLLQIAGYPTAVSSLAFTSDGSMLAVASSYMFEQGEQDHPRDAIYLRKMQDVEVRPKPRQQR